MREWKFKKQDLNCTLTINDEAIIKIKINDDKPFNVKNLDRGCVYFYDSHYLIIDGKEREVRGFILDDYDEIKAYYDNLKNEIEAQKKVEYDKEFNAILNGEKPLSISWHDGEYWWGYTAYGMDRDVIKYLHCGQDISGGLFSVDEEFSDGDIEKMKAHYEEVEKKLRDKEEKESEKRRQYEKEKAELLDGVQWKIEEYSDGDEGGRTKSYKYTVTVNGETFAFQERNLFDVGRVINPAYKISNEFSGGGVPSCKDGKWIWLSFNDGWKEVREMSQNEAKAFEIVRKYGKYNNSEVRM